MNSASPVGARLGLVTAGTFSDWVSAKLTERNKGIREPEVRLLAVVPYVLIMLLGNFIVAFGLQNHWRVSLRKFADPSLEKAKVFSW